MQSRKTGEGAELKELCRYVRIGAFLFDTVLNRFHIAGATLRLTPKAGALLKLLILQPGIPVNRELLLAQVWPGTCPTDDVVTKVVGELRRHFAANDANVDYIETLPKLGYRLLVPVELQIEQKQSHVAHEAESSVADDQRSVSPVQATRSDGEPADRVASQTAAIARSPALDETIGALESSARAKPRRTQAISRRQWQVALIGIAIVIATGVAWYMPRKRSDFANEGADLTRRLALGARPLTADPGAEVHPRFSPDGRWVAYAWIAQVGSAPKVMIRGVDGIAARRLTNEANNSEYNPVWTHQKNSVLYLKKDALGTCSIARADILNGREQQLLDCEPLREEMFDISPDDATLLLFRGLKPKPHVAMQRMRFSIGDVEPMTYARTIGDDDLEGHYSPDGKRIAFRRGALPISDIFVVDAAGGNTRQLTHLGSRIRGFAWTPDSRRLVVSSDHSGGQMLWLLDVQNGDMVSLGARGATYPDVAANGSLVYESHASPSHLIEFTFDGSDAGSRNLLGSTHAERYPSYSPDGHRLAFISDRSGHDELWLGSPEDGTVLASTDFKAAAIIGPPQWSASGQRIAVVIRNGSRGRLVSIDAASLISRAEIDPEINVGRAAYSHDGEQLYFDSDRSGTWQIWSKSLRTGELTQVTTDGGVFPVASIDSNELYFLKPPFLYLMRHDAQATTLVMPEVGLDVWNRDSFVPTRDGYYVVVRGQGALAAVFGSWSGGEPRLLTTLHGDDWAYGMTLAADRHSAIVGWSTDEAVDLYIADGLFAGKPAAGADIR